MAALGKVKWLLVGGGLIVVALFGAFFFWPLGSDQETDEGPHSFPVDMAMRFVDMQGGEQGEQKWNLRAEKATYDRGQKLIGLTDPVLTLPLEDGQAVISSSQGSYDQATGQARMWPEVSSEYQNGTARAGLAVFSRHEQRLELSKGVEFHWPKMDVWGESAVIELGNKTIVVKQKVRADFQLVLNGQGDGTL